MIIDNNVINMEFNMKEYFPHDSSARHDEKIIKLELKYGAEGYVMYFKLLEFMSENRKSYVSTSDIGAISYDFHVNIVRFRNFLEYAASDDCGILKKTGFGYESERLKGHIDSMCKQSERNSKNAKKRWDNVRSHSNKDAEQEAIGISDGIIVSDSDTCTTPTAEKRREEKSKEKDSNIVVKMTKKELLNERELEFRKTVIAYNLDKGNKYPESMIDKFLNYYTEPNRSITKMKCETYPTWEIGRRLGTWYRNSKKFNKQSTKENNRDVFREFAKGD